MGLSDGICEGSCVQCINCIVFIKVGEGFVGCVVNVLGELIDGKGVIKGMIYEMLLECKVLGVIYCQLVNELLQMGIKFIDVMILIGCGQWELIIGDCQMGKMVIVIDIIINQCEFYECGELVFCIYVVFGQKAFIVVNVVKIFEDNGVMDYIVIVFVLVVDFVLFQFYVLFVGVVVGEYFCDIGCFVLIIYDDLFKQVVVYCEVFLLLCCFLGCEAYFGDVFYLYFCFLECVVKIISNDEIVCNMNDLLEILANVKDEKGELLVKGGGLLMALLIIEMQVGDVFVYILINVIFIIDGQIFFEFNFFNVGVCFVINVGIFVFCVGGLVQIKFMKKVFGILKFDQVQYCELEVFFKFGFDFDVVIMAVLEKGKCNVEILKQLQYFLVLVEKQVVIIYLGIKGKLCNVLVEKVKEFEEFFLIILEKQYFEVFDIFWVGKFDKDVIDKVEVLVVELFVQYKK